MVYEGCSERCSKEWHSFKLINYQCYSTYSVKDVIPVQRRRKVVQAAIDHLGQKSTALSAVQKSGTHSSSENTGVIEPVASNTLYQYKVTENLFLFKVRYLKDGICRI